VRHLSPLEAALVMSVVLGAIGALASGAPGGDARTADPAVSGAGIVTGKDANKRKITIRNAHGAERTYCVDPAVEGLDRVKVGTTVLLGYRAAAALALRKNGDGMRATVEEEAGIRAPADAGAVTTDKKVTIVASVVAVNLAAMTVRLLGPEGETFDVKVKDKRRLVEVKAGDQVVAVIHEAVAVAVKPVGRTHADAMAAK
jgi:Cu/Ag efflux protein CusF